MSVGKQAASGAVWNYAAFVVSKGLLFVATVILARVLDPAQLGLMAMALTVITFLDILRDFGIGAALIHRQEDPSAAANLTFWINSSVGAILFAANWLLSPLIAGFFQFNTPSDLALLTDMLRVLGLSLFFLSLGSTHDALLQKSINYRQRMIPEVGRTVIKGALQVGLALTGFGVWSLVIGQVVGEGCATLLLWLVEKWRPAFRVELKLIRPMLKYSFHIMMVNGLGTLLMDIDYLIIGRFLGADPLGVYQIAYRVPELALRSLSQAVSTVAFPVAARLQHDREAIKKAYLDMQHYMLLLLAPLGFGLFAVTPLLMHVLFGSKWEAAIPVMEVLTIYTLIGGIGHWPGVIYKAVGRPDILNYLSAVKLVVLVPVLWWCAVNYGILGVAWGQLAVRILGVLLDMVVVARFTQITVQSNLRIIWPPFAAGALMAAAVRLLFIADPASSNLLLLIAAVPLGAAVYGVAIWLLDRTTVEAVLRQARDFINRRRKPEVGTQGERGLT